ncbi:uncharacterized protein A4U43_C07F140 [Asparagus officinalis]|uniref:Uncharacterized protein n=1 Tax=Asparagus officinalis TaxID=4686 RepID=A0A5P1EBC4_ASPOF|nr:uncharacterized protein LOC109849421 [Asparagus officinalis]ONK62079.1 uncharacterized protein A4U43_C07F140 [Asparagus officinalis]
MLARCLCVPLVSIRVGKVYKQGNLLCPSSTRGHLNLTLLPTSSMRLSFTGDDGCTERLAVLNNNFDISEVVIEEITADSSGRSFLLKLPGSKVLFFWCSEKSKLHGAELLAKMKDLLRRKPTLSHLTGISESRFESFATHLRMYLLGSSNAPEANPLSPSVESPAIVHVAGKDVSSLSQVLEASRCHFRASHASTGLPSHQDGLTPRPTTFKNGATRSLPSTRGIREKLRKRGDISNPSLFINSQLTTSVPSSSQTIGNCEDDSMRPSDGCDLLPLISHAEISHLSSSPPPSISLLPDLPLPKISTSKSMFSPYYCLCPPCPSSLQYSLTPSHLPLPVTYDESIPLPPLSSLLSSGPPGPPVISNSGVPVPTWNLPSLLPEPIVRLPLPVTSLVTLPTSQQFPTFTPYMSDPIVHTPVIDVCSLGQGYLVSTGPAISSAVPPLLPSFVNHPLIPNTESAVEKNARETLRMLMAFAIP